MKSSRLLESILNNLSEGVTVQDAQGKLVYANQKAAHLVGFKNPEELINHKPNITNKFIMLDEMGNNLDYTSLPGRNAIKTKEVQSKIIRFKYISGGEEQWSWVEAKPIFDENNKFIGVVNTFFDVTGIKKSEYVLNLLNKISDKLSRTLSYEEGLKKFASLVVPVIADWCSIDILNEDKQLVTIALNHVDSKQLIIAQELIKTYPHSKNQKSGIWHVLKTGKTEIYPTITKKQLVTSALDEHHAGLLQQLNIRSAIIAPLTVRNKILGVITYALSNSKRSYSKSDLNTIDSITHRAALLLDNTRLFTIATKLIKKQKNTLEELMKSDQTLRLALNAGHMGVWDYNIVNNTFSWSDGLVPIYGPRRGNIIGTLDKFIAHIIPADRKRIKKSLLQAIKKKSVFQEEFRIGKNNKKFRWIYKIGEVQLNEKNEAIRIIGIDTDITDKKIVEEKIRQNENKFKSIFEWSQDIIFITDDEINILDLNNTASKMLGRPKSEIIGHNFSLMLSKENRNKFLKSWKKLQKKSWLRDTFEVHLNDSHKLMMEYNATYHFLPNRNLFVARDISKTIEEKNRRERMIGVTSHELRTPIASIKIFIDILKRELTKNKDIKSLGYLDKINEKTDTMTYLVNNLLDVARIEKGQMEFYWEMFSFNEYISQLVAELQLTFKTHKIIYNSTTEVNIVSDKHRLSQILINLIRNAVKYSPQAKKIIINVESNNQRVILSVKDFGIGIPKKDLSKIFNIFYRINMSSQKKVYGLGVGLFISSQIISKMGGKIWATSRLGHGSTFYVDLPLAPKKNINNL